MKTFAEALETVYADIPLTDQGEPLPPAELLEGAARFEEIIRDALHHQRTQDMIAHLLMLVRIGEIPPETALVSAFANGLRCGIEMERQPLGEGT